MTTPFEEFMARSLANPEVKRKYDALAPEFEALEQSIRTKQAKKSTQRASRRILKTHPNLAPKR